MTGVQTCALPISDLSMTSVVLSGVGIVSGVGRADWLTARELRAIWRFVLGAGLVLYPLALGIGPFDPYELGYRSPWLVLVFGGLTCLAWWVGLRLPVLCLAVGAGAFAVGVLPTDNLWDYVLDPFAVIAAMRPKPSGVASARTISSSGTWDQSSSRSVSLINVCWRSPVSSSIRRSVQPSRPSAMTCCRFPSLKTFAIPAGSH